jgi:hypothetical protein
MILPAVLAGAGLLNSFFLGGDENPELRFSQQKPAL